jgi:hypothetical protein
MRSDQFADEALFGFPEASQLKAAAVELEWKRRDLYGLAFARLQVEPAAGQSFTRLTGMDAAQRLPVAFAESERAQQHAFEVLAGPYMGGGPRRGKTYTWLHNHLGDALEGSVRAVFLIALRHSAEHLPTPKESNDPLSRPTTSNRQHGNSNANTGTPDLRQRNHAVNAAVPCSSSCVPVLHVASFPVSAHQSSGDLAAR